MKRISASKEKSSFWPGALVGRRPNVGRKRPGRVRSGCSGTHFRKKDHFLTKTKLVHTSAKKDISSVKKGIILDEK